MRPEGFRERIEALRTDLFPTYRQRLPLGINEMLCPGLQSQPQYAQSIHGQAARVSVS